MSTAIELAVIAAVAALTLRRLVFLAAALAPRRPSPTAPDEPSVSVLVAARNEFAVAHQLLAALAQLDYPAERLSFVLVSDGCTDDTTTSFRHWAARRPSAQVIELPTHVGKAAALNEGLELAAGELVVALDADLRPQPGFLRELVPLFADERLAAAATYLRPANSSDNVVTRYAAVTSWVHQLVTSAGADRLGLNPPTFGAAAYRRDALEAIGGFPPVPVGVDVATSRLLTRQGWRTRFAHTSIVDNTVASTLADYWRQHVRWARGSFGAAGNGGRSFRGTYAQRLEAWASRMSYGDRLVFALAVTGAVVGFLPAWLPVIYLVAPGAEIVAASLAAGARRELPRVLVATVLLFPVDLLASLVAIVAHLTRRPHRWHGPRRVPAHADEGR